MAHLSLLLLVLAASLFVATCGDMNETVGAQLEQSGVKAFVYNPGLQGLNGTQVNP